MSAQLEMPGCEPRTAPVDTAEAREREAERIAYEAAMDGVP